MYQRSHKNITYRDWYYNNFSYLVLIRGPGDQKVGILAKSEIGENVSYWNIDEEYK